MGNPGDGGKISYGSTNLSTYNPLQKNIGRFGIGFNLNNQSQTFGLNNYTILHEPGYTGSYTEWRGADGKPYAYGSGRGTTDQTLAWESTTAYTQVQPITLTGHITLNKHLGVEAGYNSTLRSDQTKQPLTDFTSLGKLPGEIKAPDDYFSGYAAQYGTTPGTLAAYMAKPAWTGGSYQFNIGTKVNGPTVESRQSYHVMPVAAFDFTKPGSNVTVGFYGGAGISGDFGGGNIHAIGKAGVNVNVGDYLSFQVQGEKAGTTRTGGNDLRATLQNTSNLITDAQSGPGSKEIDAYAQKLYNGAKAEAATIPARNSTVSTEYSLLNEDIMRGLAERNFKNNSTNRDNYALSFRASAGLPLSESTTLNIHAGVRYDLNQSPNQFSHTTATSGIIPDSQFGYAGANFSQVTAESGKKLSFDVGATLSFGESPAKRAPIEKTSKTERQVLDETAHLVKKETPKVDFTRTELTMSEGLKNKAKLVAGIDLADSGVLSDKSAQRIKELTNKAIHDMEGPTTSSIRDNKALMGTLNELQKEYASYLKKNEGKMSDKAKDLADDSVQETISKTFWSR